MARIVAAYTPKALPKTFETVETHVKIIRLFVMEEDPKTGKQVPSRDENGRKIKAGPNTLEFEQVPSKGGIMFTFPRGHSIRLSSPEQLKQFKLSEQPRLVDLDLGEEVNAAGVPTSMLAVLSNSDKSGGDFGMVDSVE